MAKKWKGMFNMAQRLRDIERIDPGSGPTVSAVSVEDLIARWLRDFDVKQAAFEGRQDHFLSKLGVGPKLAAPEAGTRMTFANSKDAEV